MVRCVLNGMMLWILVSEMCGMIEKLPDVCWDAAPDVEDGEDVACIEH